MHQKTCHAVRDEMYVIRLKFYTVFCRAFVANSRNAQLRRVLRHRKAADESSNVLFPTRRGKGASDSDLPTDSEAATDDDVDSDFE